MAYLVIVSAKFARAVYDRLLASLGITGREVVARRQADLLQLQTCAISPVLVKEAVQVYGPGMVLHALVDTLTDGSKVLDGGPLALIVQHLVGSFGDWVKEYDLRKHMEEMQPSVLSRLLSMKDRTGDYSKTQHMVVQLFATATVYIASVEVGGGVVPPVVAAGGPVLRRQPRAAQAQQAPAVNLGRPPCWTCGSDVHEKCDCPGYTCGGCQKAAPGHTWTHCLVSPLPP
jgi:hypothetical protein